MAHNEIFQYSVIPALMSGLASATSSISVSTLLSHGTFGVGTFERMDGEMVVLDGVAYHLKADGSVRAVDPAVAKAPFAMVTRFKAEMTKQFSIAGKGELEKEMAQMLPDARNLFTLVMVKGRFKRMKVRAVEPQKYPGQLLSEMTKDQSVYEYKDVKGTIVGLRSPAWSSGMSVVGLHVHFIDDERSIGGHILDLSSDGAVEVGVAACTKVNVQLPEGKEFGSRDLDLDQEGVRQAEG